MLLVSLGLFNSAINELLPGNMLLIRHIESHHVSARSIANQHRWIEVCRSETLCLDVDRHRMWQDWLLWQLLPSLLLLHIHIGRHVWLDLVLDASSRLLVEQRLLWSTLLFFLAHHV